MIQSAILILAVVPEPADKAEACGGGIQVGSAQLLPGLALLSGGFRLQYFIKSLINGFIVELLPSCCGDLGLCSLAQ